MPTAATRIIQNVLEKPGTGKPLAGRQVSIRLNTPSFIDSGAREKVRTAYATTDATGLWSVVLEVNADINPAGTWYTVSEVPGVIWTFIVPAGDATIPVPLFNCLVDAPTNPTPIIPATGNGILTSFQGRITPAAVLTKADVTGTGLAAADVGADAVGAAAAAQAAAAAASQPVDSDLTAIAALATTSFGRSVLTQADAAALRTLAGLGTAATQDSTAFDAAGAAAAAQAASQPLDSDLTALAALSTTAFGRSFLALADAAAARTLLGLGTLATQSGTFSGTSSGTNTGDQTLPTTLPPNGAAGGDLAGTYPNPTLATATVAAIRLPATVVTKTANYTAAVGEFVKADATSAGFTVTLPSSPAVGALVTVKKTDTSTNIVTVAPAGGGTIDGDANATIVAQNAGAVFEHVASNAWQVAAVTSAEGPKGDPGATGTAGATGATGASGATGATGAAGSNGTNGTNGTNGAISQLQDEGSNLTVRPTINFVGAGVTATDDAGNTRTLVTIPGGGGGGGTANALTRTAVKTGNYTAALWDLVPCDTSGGAFTVTLPAASGGLGRIAVKLVTAGNTLNLALTGSDHLNTSAGPTTGTLTLANQAIILESDGSSIWTVTADDISLTVLDARFAPIAPAASTVTNTTAGLIAVTHTNVQAAVADLDAAVVAVSRTLLLAPAGAIVETFPRNCTTVGGATANAGVAKLMAVPLLAGQVISSVNWAMSASAASPTHQWSALVNAAGTVVAVSSDATSTAITVNTTTTNTLSYTVPTTGLYYLLWMSTASVTQPGLWSATGPNANFIGIAFPPVLCGTAGSSLTTPYSVGASVGTITQAGSPFYGYLK